MLTLRIAAAAAALSVLGVAQAAPPAPTFLPLARDANGIVSKAAPMPRASAAAIPVRHEMQASLERDGSVRIECDTRHDPHTRNARLPGDAARAEQPQ